MSKAYKGGEFERHICKTLSLWWTEQERDDVFWRSSQSGGRATQRLKQGKATFGSYGDIAAVDPIGIALTSVFTIECKRGSSWGSPWDLVESHPSKAVRPFEQALEQAITSHQNAGSRFWLLLCQQDRRRAMAYVDGGVKEEFQARTFLACPVVQFRFLRNRKDEFPEEVRFFALPLDHFLRRVTPKQIMLLNERH